MFDDSVSFKTIHFLLKCSFLVRLDCDTDQETDRLLGAQRVDERGYYEEKVRERERESLHEFLFISFANDFCFFNFLESRNEEEE